LIYVEQHKVAGEPPTKPAAVVYNHCHYCCRPLEDTGDACYTEPTVVPLYVCDVKTSGNNSCEWLVVRE